MVTGPVVPENILRRRKQLEQVQAERKTRIAEQRRKKKPRAGVTFKKASEFVKEYKSVHRNLLRMKKVTKRPMKPLELESKLILVLRTRGTHAVDHKTRRFLHLLRLREANQAVFIEASEANLNMLRLISPFIAFGSPSLKTVRDLVQKRGFTRTTAPEPSIIDEAGSAGKRPKSRTRLEALTDNELVERGLGKLGIVCLEDLVHEIHSVGPNFRQAALFLQPFRLHLPRGSRAPPSAAAAEAVAAGKMLPGRRRSAAVAKLDLDEAAAAGGGPETPGWIDRLVAGMT